MATEIENNIIFYQESLSDHRNALGCIFLGGDFFLSASGLSSVSLLFCFAICLDSFWKQIKTNCLELFWKVKTQQACNVLCSLTFLISQWGVFNWSFMNFPLKLLYLHEVLGTLQGFVADFTSYCLMMFLHHDNCLVHEILLANGIVFRNNTRYNLLQSPASGQHARVCKNRIYTIVHIK